MMVCMLEHTSLRVKDRIVSQSLALRMFYKATFFSLLKGDVLVVNQPLRTPQWYKGVSKIVLDSVASMQGVPPLP